MHFMKTKIIFHNSYKYPKSLAQPSPAQPSSKVPCANGLSSVWLILGLNCCWVVVFRPLDCLWGYPPLCPLFAGAVCSDRGVKLIIILRIRGIVPPLFHMYSWRDT